MKDVFPHLDLVKRIRSIARQDRSDDANPQFNTFSQYFALFTYNTACLCDGSLGKQAYFKQKTTKCYLRKINLCAENEKLIDGAAPNPISTWAILVCMYCIRLEFCCRDNIGGSLLNISAHKSVDRLKYTYAELWYLVFFFESIYFQYIAWNFSGFKW